MINFKKQYHKVIAALLLIMSFQLPLLVTKMTHFMRKMEIKKEVKSKILKGISDEEITILTFHHQDVQRLLRWEHPREFEYQKMMYDIVSKTEKGDSVTYHCWADIKESALNHEINKLVEIACHNDPNERQNNRFQFEFFKNIFFQQTIADLYFSWNASDDILTYCPEYHFTFKSIYQLLATPPPEQT